jgi:hypothetical protein
MEPARSSTPNPPVSSSGIPSAAQPSTGSDGMRAALSTPVSSFSVSEWPLPASSPPATCSAKRLCGLDRQPAASQERTTSVSEVIDTRLPARARKEMIAEAQLEEQRCRAIGAGSIAVVSQEKNDMPVEGDEVDPTDVKSDVGKEALAMAAMENRVVRCTLLLVFIDTDGWALA